MATINLGGRVKEDDTKMSEREFYSMLDKAKKSKVKRLTPTEQKKLFNTSFVNKIKVAEQNVKKGNTTKINPDKLWKSIQ